MLDEYKQKLDAFTPEDMRAEIAILHGLWTPEGYAWQRMIDGVYGPFSAPLQDNILAREVEPGLWIKIVFNGEPGWSWYISDKPDTSYVERGGACLAVHAIADAEEEARESIRARSLANRS